jgi:hypothetical protein
LGWLTLEEIEGESFLLAPTAHLDVCYSHQEDFYAFAALSINPEELRISVKKSHGIDWDPEIVGDMFSRQVVFIGIYDGFVLRHLSLLHLM